MTDLTLNMRIKAEAAQAQRAVKATVADTRGLGAATLAVGKAGQTASAQIKQAAVAQGAAVKAAGAQAGAAIKRIKQEAVGAGEALKRGMREGAREEERVIRTTTSLSERIRGMLHRVGEAGGAFRIMGRAATSEIGRIKQAMGGLGGRLGALGLGVGIGAQIKANAVGQRDYIRMQQTAELTPLQRDAMRATNWKLASQYGVDEGSLREGANTLLAKGIKLTAVNAIMPALARTSAVTGAAPSTLANVAATAGNTFGINMEDPKAVSRMLDQMVVATRAGGMEMEDLAETIPTIAKQAKPMNLDFARALAFMEAMSSVVPDKARAATAVESGLRIFSNKDYRQQVADATGIPHLFFDENENRRAPEYALEKLSEVYSQLPTDAKRAAWIGKVTDGMDNDTKAWLTANLDPKMLGLFKDIFAQQQGAQAVVAGSLAENLDSSSAVASRLKGTFGAAFDRMATPINKVLAEAGGKLLDTNMSGEQMLGWGAGAAGATYLASRVGGPLARKLAGMVGGGADTLKNLAVGKALQDATGVMPVYVTNWAGAPAAATSDNAPQVSGGVWGKLKMGLAAGAVYAGTLGEAEHANGWLAKQEQWKRGTLGLSASESAAFDQLAQRDMPLGAWQKQHPGLSDAQAREAYVQWAVSEAKSRAVGEARGFDPMSLLARLSAPETLVAAAGAAQDAAATLPETIPQVLAEHAQQMQQAAETLAAVRRDLDALLGRPLQIEVTSDTPELHAKLLQRHERDARRG